MGIKLNLINLIKQKNEDYIKIASIDETKLQQLNDVKPSDEEKIISELKMHKILYYLYGYFFKEFQKELFEANFEAWKYGPVEVNYRKSLKSNSKFEKFNISLKDEEIIFLENTIIKLLGFSTFKLVEESHKTDPWKNNFSKSEESNTWKKINKEEIETFFVG